MRRAARLLLRALHLLVGLIALVAIAKACQYVAVAAFGDRIGSELASWIGLVPVLIVGIVVASKLRRHRARPDIDDTTPRRSP